MALLFGSETNLNNITDSVPKRALKLRTAYTKSTGRKLLTIESLEEDIRVLQSAGFFGTSLKHALAESATGQDGLHENRAYRRMDRAHEETEMGRTLGGEEGEVAVELRLGRSLLGGSNECLVVGNSSAQVHLHSAAPIFGILVTQTRS